MPLPSTDTHAVFSAKGLSSSKSMTSKSQSVCYDGPREPRSSSDEGMDKRQALRIQVLSLFVDDSEFRQFAQVPQPSPPASESPPNTRPTDKTRLLPHLHHERSGRAAAGRSQGVGGVQGIRECADCDTQERNSSSESPSKELAESWLSEEAIRSNSPTYM